ncbi:unnamed protein product [Paramecium octaurelia]|uniref:DUF1704 domain-containing protein n=1 Tax=Paramecium octaurelia TaxID=43137 RepID=A0A8S1WBY2_PAROT|nr:unnamed protein product [Paramecium octaurelia]
MQQQTYIESSYSSHSSSSSENENKDVLFSPFRDANEIQLLSEQFDITKWSKHVLPQQSQVEKTPKPIKKQVGKKTKNKVNTSSSISPQKKKSKIKRPKMKDIKPQNLESEKHLFFTMKAAYNPQFEYVEVKELGPEQPHRKYEEIALKIIDQCIKEFGSDLKYAEQEGGKLLSIEETEHFFNDYIHKLGVQDLISYEFQDHTVAPTSVVHNPTDGKSKVIIGLPINYRINRIEGVLNHEIGTHFIRKINDRQQQWYKKRAKYHMEPYLKHEEGLAVLNQVLPQALKQKGKPYLFMAALHYISSILASQMSFAKLFHELRYFIQDDEARFRECLRVKRGMRDTSQPGGMYKDQVYLTGAIKILKYRGKLNFIHLHSGKITIKDCIRLGEIGQIYTKNIYIPPFLQELEQYKKGLDKIAQQNFINFAC